MLRLPLIAQLGRGCPFRYWSQSILPVQLFPLQLTIVVSTLASHFQPLRSSVSLSSSTALCHLILHGRALRDSVHAHAAVGWHVQADKSGKAPSLGRPWPAKRDSGAADSTGNLPAHVGIVQARMEKDAGAREAMSMSW